MNTPTPYTNTHIHIYAHIYSACTHTHLSAWLHQIIKLNDLTASQHAPGPCDTLICSLSLQQRALCVCMCVRETENVREKCVSKLLTPHCMNTDVSAKVFINAGDRQRGTVPRSAVKLWSAGQRVGWSPFSPLDIDFH